MHNIASIEESCEGQRLFEDTIIAPHCRSQFTCPVRMGGYMGIYFGLSWLIGRCPILGDYWALPNGLGSFLKNHNALKGQNPIAMGNAHRIIQ
jgi:hypothetical protein